MNKFTTKPSFASPAVRQPASDVGCVATAGQTSNAVRESQIGSQMNALNEAIGRLEKAVVVISETITSVVVSLPAEKEASCATPPDALLVPLADYLRQRVRQINGAAAHLEDIGSRVEL